MTSRRGAAVAVLVVSVLACWQAAIGQQAPVFRAGVDLVAVDVFVRDDGTPVTGLTAADFIVLDNGIRQRIESIETARVPSTCPSSRMSAAADPNGGARRGRPMRWRTISPVSWSARRDC